MVTRTRRTGKHSPRGEIPSSLLVDKTAVAELPRIYIPRPRLHHLWEEWEARRLVVIQAPPGYGKSTLMAANAARSGRRVFWYTCDAYDTGVRALIAQVHAIVPRAEPPPADPFPLLIHHIRSTPEGWNFVIDDLHCLGADPGLPPFLERLAAYLPMGSTLFLASRDAVPVHTAAMCAKGTAVAVGRRELAFTADETRALVHETLPRIDPADPVLERIHARTEGWPAGLAIWLHHARGSADPQPLAPDGLRAALDPVTSTGPEGPAHDWFAYFGREVLQTLEPGLAGFLLRGAALPRLAPDLCDHVLGIRNSRGLLAKVAERGLFIEAMLLETRTAPGPSYRFHPIFREFLLKTLHDTVPRPEIASLLRRAADALESRHSWIEAAVAHADAGDAAAAIEIIETHGMALIDEGRGIALHPIVEKLQPDGDAASPRILHVLGRIHETQGRWREAEALYKHALERLHDAPGAGKARPGRTRPDTALALEIQRLLIQMHIHFGRYAAAERLCRDALASPALTDPRARAAILMQRATCLSELGGYSEAEQLLCQADATFEDADDALGRAHVQYILAIAVHHPHGDWKAARTALGKAADCYRGRSQLMTCLCAFILAVLELEDGTEWKARLLAEQTLRQAEGLRFRGVEGLCRWTLGRCALLRARIHGPGSREDREEGIAHLAAAHEIGEELPLSDLRIFPLLDEAEIHIQDGMIDVARARANAALDCARHHGVRLGEAQARIVLGSCDHAERAQAACVPAERDPADLPTAASAPSEHWDAAETLLRDMEARWQLHRLLLLRLQAGDVEPTRSAALIKELLHGVTRLRHEPLLTTHEPAAAVAVLVMAIREDIGGKRPAEILLRMGDRAIPELRALRKAADSPRIRRICSRLVAEIRAEAADSAPATRRRGDQRAAYPAGRRANRSVEIIADAPLSKPAPSAAPSLRIHALGPLRVDVGDRVLLRADWPSVQPLRVFLYLVMRRFRWVPKDEIMKALWRSDGRTRAMHSMRQALHSLRRTLEPDLQPFQTSSYIATRHGEVRLLPGAEAVCDVMRFEKALTTHKTRFATRASARAEAEDLARILRLYTGEFAEDLPRERFLSHERERLRDLWVRAARRLLSLLADARRWEEMIPLARRGIAYDRFCEAFHYHLATACLHGGNRPEALRACVEYEAVLRQDPAGLPSDRMAEFRNRLKVSGHGLSVRVD